MTSIKRSISTYILQIRRAISVKRTRIEQEKKFQPLNDRSQTSLKTITERKTELFNSALKNNDFSSAYSLYASSLPLTSKLQMLTMVLSADKIDPETCTKASKILFEISETESKVPLSFFKIIMKHYARSRNLTKCQQFMLNMIEHGITPCTQTINMLLSQYAQLNMYRESMKFLLDAVEMGLPLDNTSWSLLIHAHETQPFKTLDILKLAEDHGVNLNSFIFEACLKVFSKNRDVNGLENIIRVMKTRGIIFSRNIYNIILNGYVEAGKSKKAQEIFSEMDSKTLHTTPNIVTYNTMLKLTVKSPSETAKLLEKMKETNTRLDLATLNTIMFSFARKGDSESAQYYFDQIYEHKLKPDVVSYTTLIGVYGYNGDLIKSRELFEIMEFEGIIPTQKTFANLIEMHLECREYEQVEKIHSLMLKRGNQYNPKILECMIELHQKTSKALKFFEIAKDLSMVTARMCHFISKVLYGPGKVVEGVAQVMEMNGLKVDNQTLEFMKVESRGSEDEDRVIRLYSCQLLEARKPEQAI